MSPDPKLEARLAELRAAATAASAGVKDRCSDAGDGTCTIDHQQSETICTLSEVGP